MAENTNTLPHGQPTSLDGLIHRISVEDPEWLRDTLWLRCTKIQRDKQLAAKQATGRRQVSMWSTAATLPPPMPLRALVLPEIPLSDLTDRLSVMPHDIRMEILSFLFLPTIERIEASAPDPLDRGSLCLTHTYNQLALVNRTWRDQVEAFCNHQLLALKQAITSRQEECWEPWRYLRTFTSCARMKLVVRVLEYCAFCGHKSARIAQTWPGLKCCFACEGLLSPVSHMIDICRGGLAMSAFFQIEQKRNERTRREPEYILID